MQEYKDRIKFFRNMGNINANPEEQNTASFLEDIDPQQVITGLENEIVQLKDQIWVLTSTIQNYGNQEQAIAQKTNDPQPTQNKKAPKQINPLLLIAGALFAMFIFSKL